jgi:hypothetical protein
MQRNDIYLCSCCLSFYNELTGKHVDVPYSEMPADLAVELMIQRNGMLLKHPKTKQKRHHSK